MIDQLEKEARESSQEKGKVGKDRELIMPKAKPFTAQAYGLAAVMLGSMAFVPVYGSVPLAISPLVKVVVNSSCAQEKKNKPKTQNSEPPCSVMAFTKGYAKGPLIYVALVAPRSHGLSTTCLCLSIQLKIQAYGRKLFLPNLHRPARIRLRLPRIPP